jgi:Protein of unknown function (DUF3089)
MAAYLRVLQRGAVATWFASLSLLFVAASAARAQAPNNYADSASWLCRPGRTDACAVDLTATIIAPDGKFSRESWTANPDAPIDCFYVYPTVSAEPSLNSDMVQTAAETNVVHQQFARFGSKCRMYAPMYRQVTLLGLTRSLVAPADGSAPVSFAKLATLAYDDVRDAWRYYLAHDNNGRGVVLIGHSQGSTMLTQLIREEIDGKPIQSKIVSAILAGTNVSVPKDHDVGGTFQHLPLCHFEAQTGCVIVFSTFRSTAPPPPNPFFGRASGPGMVSACVNPAALEGGSGGLRTYFSTIGRTAIGPNGSHTWVAPNRPIDTPFVSLLAMFTAECASNGNSSGYLEVTVHPSMNNVRADDINAEVRFGNRALATWGMHNVDMNLTIGNLVQVVGEEAEAYSTKPASP